MALRLPSSANDQGNFLTNVQHFASSWSVTCRLDLFRACVEKNLLSLNRSLMRTPVR